MDIITKAKKFVRLSCGLRSKLPEDVSIEITTRCNLMCPMCYRFHLGIVEKDMPFPVYTRIIAEMPAKLRRLSLTGLGESLLHPDFPRMLEHAKEGLPWTKVDIATNAMSLDRSLRKLLIDSGIWMLTFSVEGIGEYADGITHPVRETAVENFRAFAEANVKAGKPVRTRLQTVMVNDSQLRTIVDFARSTSVDVINFARMDVPAGAGIARKPEGEIRRLYTMARRMCRRAGISYFCINDQNIFLRIATRYDRGCVLYDNYAYIDVDGNVLPCCFMRDCSFGNIKAESLPVIWRAEKHRTFSPQRTAACQSCDIYKFHYNH